MKSKDDRPQMHVNNAIQDIEQDIDRSLAILLAENLAENFELFVVCYEKMITHFVQKRFDGYPTEDIVQEAFIHAYEALTKKSTEAILQLKLRSWFYIIVKNKGIDFVRFYRRRAGSTQSLDLVEASEQGSGTSQMLYESAEEEVIRREMMDDLSNMIKRLPELRYRAFVDHYLHGKTYPEIADALGLSVNTVKSHGWRAAEYLRKMIDKEKRNEL